MIFCRIFSQILLSGLLKRLQQRLHGGGETSLTFVFSSAPDADPTPSLERHSRPGQQTSRTDEAAEFPTRKKTKWQKELRLPGAWKKAFPNSSNDAEKHFYPEKHDEQGEPNRLFFNTIIAKLQFK